MWCRPCDRARLVDVAMTAEFKNKYALTILAEAKQPPEMGLPSIGVTVQSVSRESKTSTPSYSARVQMTRTPQGRSDSVDGVIRRYLRLNAPRPRRDVDAAIFYEDFANAPRPWGDVEAAVYDEEFDSRMREVRLMRAARSPGWPKARKALWSELRERRARAKSLLGDWVEEVDFHDGHVAEVVLKASDFVRRGAELQERAPWVHHVHLTGFGEARRSSSSSLFQCAYFSGIVSLGIVEQGLDDDDVVALVSSPYLQELRWLDLSGNQLTERAFEALSRLHQLVYVGLNDNRSPSPVDEFGEDAIDGYVVESWPTAAGRALERRADRRLTWLHAPAMFPRSYPPTPLDVAVAG